MSKWCGYGAKKNEKTQRGSKIRMCMIGKVPLLIVRIFFGKHNLFAFRN